MKKRSNTPYVTCNIKPGRRSVSRTNRNRFYRYKGNYQWKGVQLERYKPTGNDWLEVIRQVIIGNHGESTRFHLRYFEISPGGYTSYEWHNHEHVVIGIRGKGRVKIGKRIVEMGFLDTLYISPKTPHRLYNPYDEPFGFFCIVNAKRDKPKLLDS